MDEDIDMSFIIPIDTVVDKSDDDIVLQILGERQHPQQNVHLAQSSQHKVMPPDVVALTEEDIMGILEKETIVDDSSADVFTNLLSDTISTTDASTISFHGILPQATPEVGFQETYSQVKNKSSIPSFVPPTKTTVGQIQRPHGSVPGQGSTQRSGVPSAPANVQQETPLTINLPPDLPAGRYIIRHSVTDPSVVELSFPDNPELNPITLPVTPRAAPPSQQLPAVSAHQNRTVSPGPSSSLGRKSQPLNASVTIAPPVSNLAPTSGFKVLNQTHVIQNTIPQVLPQPSRSQLVTVGSSQVGFPGQITKIPASSAQAAVKVGQTSFQPKIFQPGIHGRNSQLVNSGITKITPVVNVSNVQSGITMLGAASAPVQIRYANSGNGRAKGQNVTVLQTKSAGAPLQVLESGQKPLQKTILTITEANKGKPKFNAGPFPKVPHQPAKNSTGLVGISAQHIEKMVPAADGNKVAPSEQHTIPVVLSNATCGPTVNILGKAFINQKGELVFTEAAGVPIDKNTQQQTPTLGKIQKSLAPLSSLLNFAQLGKNKSDLPSGSIPPTDLSKEHNQTPIQPKALKKKSPVLRTLTTNTCTNIEGQIYCPKVIIDDGLVDMVTEEVVDEIPLDFSLNTMRLREQSHKMISVTIRESCIGFRNEAGALLDLQAKHRMMKEASARSERATLEGGITTGDKSSCVTPKNQKALKDPVAQDTDVILLDSQEENSEKEETISETTDAVQKEIQQISGEKAPQTSTSPIEIVEIQSDDNPAESGEISPVKPGNEINSRQSELTKLEETEAELDRLTNLYKKRTEDQNKVDELRKLKLDKLAGCGSRAQLLKKLFSSVPHFVDDPLTGDGNSPMYFCCYLCPFASFNEAKVCVHWTIAHLQSKPYVCGYCSARFTSSGKAHRHMALAHRGRKVLIKMIPSEIFTNPLQFEFVQEGKISNVLCPMIEVGSEEDTSPKRQRFACKECPFTALKENDMLDHVREVHFSLLPYACVHCDKEFRHSSQVDSHHETEHSDLEKSVRVDSRLVKLQEKLRLNDFYSVIPINRPVPFEPAYDYWRCAENTKDKSKMQYVCTVCTFVTKRLNAIWKHVREIHELPEGVYCKRCSSYHRLTHVERANEFFICYCCCTLTSLKLTQQPHFIRLKQVFLCLKCSAQMEDLLAMKRHIKQHHIEVYPYTCSVCRAKFVIKQEAQNHCLGVHGSDVVLEKQLSLVSKVMKRVRKLHIKYMFVEPEEEDGDLSTLWTEHGLAIVREGEERLTRVEVETATHVTQGEDGEANVEEGTEVDTTLFNVDKGGDPLGAGPSTEDDFKGLSHYRCRLCQYKCLDRSCMSRHVKYMHLRIHPHSCPFCGYSNVEKTKVKIHIMNLHNKSSKKVRTNTTLVTALGEESKKHFVRVYTDGREISQVDPTPRSGRAAPAHPTEDSGDDLQLNDPNIKLEPLEDDDEHIRHLDRELQALSQQPVPRLFIRNKTVAGTSEGLLPEGVEIKEEPVDMDDLLDERLQQKSIGQVVHLQRTTEDMEVDAGNSESLADPFARSQTGARGGGSAGEHSVLYQMLTSHRVMAQKRRAEAIARQAKRRRIDHSIYPDPNVIRDRKLRMLPVVILEDVIATYLSTC